jgi:hypothetical protein
MQALRDADLKELQERYGGLLELKNQQHELLAKLRQRLEVAAVYLKELQNPDDSAGGSRVSVELYKLLSGDFEPNG